MKKNKHIFTITTIPAVAQVSNFQIKLQATTDIIDRLLLVPRQSPWKATGPTGETTDTDTNVDTGTITGETTTGV
ncbi:MAG TPA: hypothetical protein PLT82_01705 [Candidatus Hydrogenedens sp.]|nr:hypothetical protein [Candidatus Hydrogenedens sp.]HOK08505.1 hypothetical protein [Candidatus Hydrogenedens sp.]HOL20331.1 hypothetical protein [Candidatus Hydrogenedens sp.]HPP57825.1 hypothetical protein [Candidatus Hydrogenedens sp.]